MIEVVHNKVLHTVGLKALYNEYNCSTKMVGRLSAIYDNVDTKYGLTPEATTVFENNKEAIIKDFFDQMYKDHHKVFGTLMTRNVMFPADNGTYRPSVLLYSDRIMNAGKLNWFCNFLGLIYEVKDKFDTYGVRVVEGPIFSNLTYGGTVLSRVWMVFPPCMKDQVLIGNQKIGANIINGSKASLAHGYYKRDEEEIKRYIA